MDKAHFDFPRVRNDEIMDNTILKKQRIMSSIILDFIICAFIYILSAIIYHFVPPREYYFSPFDKSMSYPDNEEVLSNVLMGIINYLFPLLLILLYSLFILRSKWDTVYGLKGCIESLTLSFFITVFLWAIISDVRPNFLEICNPDLQILKQEQIYDTKICRNSLIKSDLRGFPSGHMSTTVSSWSFLSLFLSNTLRVWDKTGHFWKLLFSFLPSLIPLWVGITRINDHKHFVYQVLVGAFIGLISSLLTYKLNFGRIFRENHNKDKSENPKTYWSRKNISNLDSRV